MSQQNVIDVTPNDFFPNSDPHSFTPVTRSGNPQVVTIGNLKVILVEEGRGVHLQTHLASHGITATVHRGREGPFDRLEIVGNVDRQTVQGIVAQWQS